MCQLLHGGGGASENDIWTNIHILSMLKKKCFVNFFKVIKILKENKTEIKLPKKHKKKNFLC